MDKDKGIFQRKEDKTITDEIEKEKREQQQQDEEKKKEDSQYKENEGKKGDFF